MKPAIPTLSIRYWQPFSFSHIARLCLCFVISAVMFFAAGVANAGAITVINSDTLVKSSSVAGTTQTLSFTAGAGADMLIVELASEGGLVNFGGITYNGVVLNAVPANADTNRTGIFYLDLSGFDTTQAYDLNVIFTGTANGMGLAVVSVNGSGDSIILDTSQANVVTDTEPVTDLTIVTTQPDAFIVVGGFANENVGSNTGTATPDNQLTTLYAEGEVGSCLGLAGYHTVGMEGSYSYDHSYSNDKAPWHCIAAAFVAPNNPAPQPPKNNKKDKYDYYFHEYTQEDLTWNELVAQGYIDENQRATDPDRTISGSRIDVINQKVQNLDSTTADNPILWHLKFDTPVDADVPHDFNGDGSPNSSLWTIGDYSRWFQQDDNTAVFRMFAGDYGRIEASSERKSEWKWTGGPSASYRKFEATYLLVDTFDSSAIFQLKCSGTGGPAWALHIRMRESGQVIARPWANRNDSNYDIVLAEDAINQPLKLEIYDNGYHTVVYVNDEITPAVDFTLDRFNDNGSRKINYFRWGMYKGGSSPFSNGGMVFVTGAKIATNQSLPGI